MPQNSRDQVQAYRFMQRRVRTALLEGDPESNDRPMARLGIATYAGAALAILLIAIIGIIGVLRPGGSKSWQQAGALIDERETTARYVYLNDTLYPVLNYASAKLILGDRLKVVGVSRNSLTGVQHGDPIGIPNAPDSIPDSGHIVGAAWSVCSAQTVGGATTASATIEPGFTAAGAAVTDSANPERGLLLKSPSAYYLAWNDAVFPVPSQWLVALGYSEARPFPVDDTLVASIPQGPALAPPTLTGVGTPVAPFAAGAPSRRVGQVLSGPQGTSYLVLANGLATVTPLLKALLLADRALAPAYPGSSVSAVSASPGELTAAPKVSLPSTTAAQTAPSTPPGLLTVPQSAAEQVCALFAGDGSLARVVFGAAQTPPAGLVTSPVRLATGYGALVRTPPGGVAASAPTSSAPTASVSVGASSSAAPSPRDTGTTYLVTDTGIAYPIADDGTSLQALGLQSAPVSVLPPAVVRALGTPGPTLSQGAAETVVGAGTVVSAANPSGSTATIHPSSTPSK